MIRIAMFLLIAAGVAGFGLVAYMVMPSETAVAAAAPAVPRLTVLVAAKPLRPGTLLKPEDLTPKEVNEDRLSVGHVLDQADAKRALVGGMVLRNLLVGDVVRLPVDVLRPADHGFLAAVLTPGTRAVSVAVDTVSGIAGLIWPGDFVDLILTQSLEDPALAAGRRVVAETVLRNVRVIAIDQQLAQGMTGATGEAAARTVTLEVSAEHAEHVQVATRLGRLSLTVRSAEAGPEVTRRAGGTYGADVSNALPSQQKLPAAAGSIKVFGGASEGKEFKF